MVSVHAPESHYQSPIVRFGLRLFAVILILSGVAVSLPVYRSIIDARGSGSWPTVVGTVRSSSVNEQVAGTRPTYKAEVVYDYVVGGQPYTNDRISFRDVGGTDRSDAEAIVAKYPAGSTPTVLYKAADPHASVLEAGAPPRVYLMGLLPPGMIVLAVVLWISAKRTAVAVTHSTSAGVPA